MSEIVKQELQKATFSNTLHLCYMQLSSFPSSKGVDLSLLSRIDLSYNNISLLPPFIGELKLLRELWVHNNPLTHLPSFLSNCEELEVIDMRNTRVSTIPDELCLLRKLYEIDYSDTPLQSYLGNHTLMKDRLEHFFLIALHD